MNLEFKEECSLHPNNKDFYIDLFWMPWCQVCLNEANYFCEIHQRHIPCRKCLKEQDNQIFEEAIQEIQEIIISDLHSERDVID